MPHSECQCSLWATQPDLLRSQGVPDCFCGHCEVCGRPGHVRHFPGATPVSGTWCDPHYQRLLWLHPMGWYGRRIYIAAFLILVLALAMPWAHAQLQTPAQRNIERDNLERTKREQQEKARVESARESREYEESWKRAIEKNSPNPRPQPLEMDRQFLEQMKRADEARKPILVRSLSPDEVSRLETAVMANDAAELGKILSGGRVTVSKELSARQPLALIATRNGNRTILAAVLAAGWPPTLDGEGNSLAAVAARRGDVDMLRLVANKAVGYFNECNLEGLSALGMAVRHRQQGAVELMTSDFGKSLVDMNACAVVGTPALVAAVAMGNVAAVRLLLAAGADPEARSKSGDTATALASARAGTQPGGAEIDSLMSSALGRKRGFESRALAGRDLFAAIGRQDAAGVRDALARGADPKAKAGVETAFEAAVRSRSVAIVEVIAGVAAPSRDDLEKAVGLARAHAAWAKEGNREVLRWLLAKTGINERVVSWAMPMRWQPAGSDSDAIDAVVIAELLAHGLRADALLRQVAHQYGPRSLRVLLDAGANARATLSLPSGNEPRTGVTLLMLVAGRHVETRPDDQPEMARMLVSAGVDVNALDSERRGALHRAVASMNLQTVQVLVKAGAKVDVADYLAKPPIHGAVSRLDRPEAMPMIKLLLAAGADPNGAFEWAVLTAIDGSQAARAAVRLLLEAGADPGKLRPEVLARAGGIGAALLRPAPAGASPVPAARPDSSAKSSAWELLGTGEKGWRTFVDRSTRSSDGATDHILVLLDTNDGSSYRFKFEARCAESQLRTATTEIFSEPMGRGALRFRRDVPSAWRFAPADVILRELCAAKRASVEQAHR